MMSSPARLDSAVRLRHSLDALGLFGVLAVRRVTALPQIARSASPVREFWRVIAAKTIAAWLPRATR